MSLYFICYVCYAGKESFKTKKTGEPPARALTRPKAQLTRQPKRSEPLHALSLTRGTHLLEHLHRLRGDPVLPFNGGNPERKTSNQLAVMAIDLLPRLHLYLPLHPHVQLPPPPSPQRYQAILPSPCLPTDVAAVYEHLRRTQGAPSSPFSSFSSHVLVRILVTRFCVSLLTRFTRTTSTPQHRRRT